VSDADPFLRRLEWTAVTACLGMAAVALVIAGGQPGPAVAVLAGGGLIGVSYWTISLGVSALAGVLTPTSAVDSATPRRSPTRASIVAKVTLRYALLALLAYVMIARLRLHPLGLLAGASSVVAAASVEALRLLLKKS